MSHANCRTRKDRARAAMCPWILQAPTMPAAIGTKNKIGTRVERREKPSNSLPP